MCQNVQNCVNKIWNVCRGSPSCQAPSLTLTSCNRTTLLHIRGAPRATHSDTNSCEQNDKTSTYAHTCVSNTLTLLNCARRWSKNDLRYPCSPKPPAPPDLAFRIMRYGCDTGPNPDN